jgi:hypothetical protein
MLGQLMQCKPIKSTKKYGISIVAIHDVNCPASKDPPGVCNCQVEIATIEEDPARLSKMNRRRHKSKNQNLKGLGK